MLILNELDVLNFKAALVASGKSIRALSLFDMLVQLLFRKNSTFSALVRTFEKVLWALTLQMVQIVIVSEFGLRATFFALECHLV